MAELDVRINRLNKQSKLLISAMLIHERGYETITEVFNPAWIRERLDDMEKLIKDIRETLDTL